MKICQEIDWLCLYKVQVGGGCRKNLNLMLKSNGMLSKKSVSLDKDVGVKVLSQKNGPDDNFQNAKLFGKINLLTK